jgi:hypothetical protein
MQFVLKTDYESRQGEPGENIKVFGALGDAERYFFAILAVMDGRASPPRSGNVIVRCAVYEADTSDIREAVRLVGKGETKLLRSDENPYPENTISEEELDALFPPPSG